MSRTDKRKRLPQCLFALILIHICFFVYAFLHGSADLIFAAIGIGVAFSLVGIVTSMFIENGTRKIIIASCNLCTLVVYVSIAYDWFFIELPRALEGLPPG